MGFEAIAEAGPGGLFTGLAHTVEHFREQLWEPSIWAHEPLETWIAQDGKIDVERALVRYDALMAEAAGTQFSDAGGVKRPAGGYRERCGEPRKHIVNQRPSVMFIIGDQHNAECPDCAGHPQ